jgi:apolipoprotein N-acyltransferase
VQGGARLLLVITNDAWFGPTAAAYQHAQASTFRAVELRVPVARAANTGWSGCIDASGRWLGSVRDADGAELFVPGTAACDLALPQAADGQAGPSAYLRWGDWFAWLCIGLTAAWLLDTLRRLPYNQGLMRGV